MHSIQSKGELSPYENYYKSPLPTAEELTSLSAYEILHLANKIAWVYKCELKDCSAVPTYIEQPLALGISLNRTKVSTVQSLAQRLQDPKWWRRKVISLADELREHQAQMAGLLGGKNPRMVCCTDETLAHCATRKVRTDMALKKQYKRKKLPDGATAIFSLYDIAESSKKSRLNELFLDIKALEKIAESQGYGCVFITLTAAPEFHSNPKHGRNSYSGASAKDANDSIKRDWKSVLDSLDNLGVGRKSGNYFGFRVVELHEDGCPHWHILMFFDKTIGILETVSTTIARLYKDRGAYFQAQRSGIIRIIEKTDDATAKPSSYMHNYICKALGDESDLSGNALRYKYAIRAMRARQYAFFGMKCSMGKQRALKAVSRVESAPTHLKGLADELHVSKNAPDRNARQLQARIDFLTGGADDVELLAELTVNRYGESVEVKRWIRHRLDATSVQISGLCEDITEREAKAQAECRQQVESGDVVTFMINYSSKSEESSSSPNLLQRLRIYKQDQELATMLGLNLSELYSNGIVTRAISPYARPRSAFSSWCRLRVA